MRRGIGHDQRIGFSFLFPGAGYGGSCFPKDVRAIIKMAEVKGLPARMMHSVDEVNEAQKHVLPRKVLGHLGADAEGKTVAVWGLAFKPRTDDIREAPALVLIDALLEGRLHRARPRPRGDGERPRASTATGSPSPSTRTTPSTTPTPWPSSPSGTSSATPTSP